MGTNYKDIVAKINSALQENNAEVFLSYCADDIVWTMVGEEPVRGKQAVMQFLAPMVTGKTAEITLHRTIEEGYLVASDGTMKMPDGESEMAFCDLYRFDGDIIAEITSYIVEMKNGKKLSA